MGAKLVYPLEFSGLIHKRPGYGLSPSGRRPFLVVSRITVKPSLLLETNFAIGTNPNIIFLFFDTGLLLPSIGAPRATFKAVFMPKAL